MLINIAFSQRSVILTLQTFILQVQNEEFLKLLQVSVFQLLGYFCDKLNNSAILPYSASSKVKNKSLSRFLLNAKQFLQFLTKKTTLI